MPLHTLWDIYRAQGYAGIRRTTPHDALDHFYLALLAFGADDFAAASVHAHRAAALEPDHLVFRASAVYLDRVVERGKAGVYVDGEAFAAFVRGGGNVGLYATASAALRAIYAEYRTLRLLDIGVGDGMALLPALPAHVTRLDLLEPSAAMLAKTTAALDTRGVAYHAHNVTLQDFIATETAQTWDIIQATWSLQSIPPAERPFRWLREHTDRLLITEFDVPDFSENYAPERVQYVVDTYARGLSEYTGDGGRVAQGFLMPVLFGYFDCAAARPNWEEPIAGWAADLRAAGFETVQTRKLSAYFWADAYLIDAR
jgi:hypothetical protein